MQWDKCALIITSSVHVNTRHTALRDPRERERQYVEAILFFIRETPFQRIVVCDNSGYRYPGELLPLAAKHGKWLELLGFTGSLEAMERQGKGYGEGEIMAHVFLHSRLLAEVEGFLKVSGRLRLTNVEKLLGKANHQRTYFMPVSLIRPRWLVPAAARPCVEVRVYYTTKIVFSAVLLDAYRQVSDDRTYFLEHAYHDALAASSVKVHCFPAAPEIAGMSGSNGWSFKERPGWKKVLIRGISHLGYITPIYNNRGKGARKRGRGAPGTY
jgi:hypothetical protein